MKHLRRHRRLGFNLIEVMIATAILVASLSIIVTIQVGAVRNVQRAKDLVVATDLAQQKMAEAMMTIELEGVGSQDVYEHGDFDDFGDDQRLEFGNALDKYHWQYWVEEIDFALSSDVAGFLGGMGGEDGEGGLPGMAAGSANDGAEDMMNQLGFGGDQLSDQLGQFVRRVRVRVWWGEDDKDAEERGQEVVLTTHIISPEGAFLQMGGDPNNPVTQ